jgi:NTP pyrophosphatase (non-canonical NTP hydrolase)
VDFGRYQRAAVKTAPRADSGQDAVIVPLLGLIGEVGSVATAYNKRLRDGAGYQLAKQRIREELGEVLWHVATLADSFELDLEDVAAASLEKAKDRWRTTDENHVLLDETVPEAERLPRLARFTFTPTVRTSDGRTVVVLTRDGIPVGDPLTDATHIDDDYRYHDAFHLAYVAVLGWSPGRAVAVALQAQELSTDRRGRRRRPRDRHRGGCVRAGLLLRVPPWIPRRRSTHRQ